MKSTVSMFLVSQRTNSVALVLSQFQRRTLRARAICHNRGLVRRRTLMRTRRQPDCQKKWSLTHNVCLIRPVPLSWLSACLLALLAGVCSFQVMSVHGDGL